MKGVKQYSNIDHLRDFEECCEHAVVKMDEFVAEMIVEEEFFVNTQFSDNESERVKNQEVT